MAATGGARRGRAGAGDRGSAAGTGAGDRRPGDPQRDALAAELVEPLLSTGRLGDAESAGPRVLARGPDPAVEVMVRTGLAGVLAMGARYPEAIHQLEQAATSPPSRNAHPWPPPGRC